MKGKLYCKIVYSGKVIYWKDASVCFMNFCIILIISNIMVINIFTYHIYLIRDPKREFVWVEGYIHSWCRVEKFVPSDALKIHSLTLYIVRFLSTLFSKLFFLLTDDFQRIHIFINKICMAINLWELWSALTLKDAASSAGEITQGSVNSLHHLMTWSRFLKKSRKRCEHFHDLLCI